MTSAAAKLGLGTVQWGMPYGIANERGRPSLDELAGIIRLAAERGIALLDTAALYGEAESMLGELGNRLDGFAVVTKTMHLEEGHRERALGAIAEGFFRSLERIRRTRVAGLLAHRVGDLLSDRGDALWQVLQSFKERALVDKLGVSVYRPEELESILERYAIDVVQLPLNIYDQRFRRAGLLQRLKERGIEIHVRSAFLQGLLLLNPERLPGPFAAIMGHHARMHAALGRMGLSPLEGALGYCLNCPQVDKVIVGCESVDQLKGILAAADKAEGFDAAEMAAYAIEDTDVTLPSNWPASVYAAQEVAR